MRYIVYVFAGFMLVLPACVTAAGASNAVQSVDLTAALQKRGLERRSQGHRGTCSVFVITAALEFALGSDTKPEPLSVEFLNWAANQVSGHAQDGGFFVDMWKGFQAYGICAEAEMPYRDAFNAQTLPSPEIQRSAKHRLKTPLKLNWIKEWNVKTGLAPEQLQEIKQTLTRGFPVCAGLRWPRNERWTNGILEVCPPEAVFDGHSVLLVGFKDDPAQPGGGVFVFRNSNGGRDGRMPYEYARRYMNDALWIEKP